jgi:phosphoserine phosphatase RsbU/P
MLYQSGGPINGPSLLLALIPSLIVLAGLAIYVWRRLQSRRALEARVAELGLLADIGQALLDAPLGMDELAQTIYQQTSKIAATGLFQLGLFEADRYRLLLWMVDGVPRSPAEFRLQPDAPGLVGWVRDQRRSLLVRDFEAERDTLPAQPRYAAADPPRSAVFLPLIAGEAALGCLVLQSRQPAAYDEPQLRLLTIAAHYVAGALQNAQALEQQQRRTAQLELLTEVSRQVNSLQPLPDLYQQIVGQVSLCFEEYAVSYYEREGDLLRLRATSLPEMQGRKIAFRLGTGVVGSAALSVRPVVAQELPDLPADPAAGVSRPEQSTLAVPVEIDGRVLGVLEAQSRQRAAFDEGATAMFTALAGQIALAILEAQMYAAEQRRSEQLAAIARASRTVASALELDELLREVLALAAGGDTFGYQRARIYAMREDRLICAASTQPEEVTQFDGWETRGPAYPLAGPGLIARVARERQPLLAADVTAHPAYRPDPYLEGVCGWMAAPMVMGPHLLGVFECLAAEAGAFGEHDLQTLQTLADYLAVALRNANLFAAERRRRQLAETLREVSAALTATLDLNAVLDLILDGLASAVPYDTASILLTDEAGDMLLRAVRGAPSAQAALGHRLDLRLFPPGTELPATVPFNEVDHWGEYHTLLSIPEPHECLGAVLAVNKQHLGYLAVDRAGQQRFSPEEVELVAAFASQAAVAIENARLYTKEREEARSSASLLQVAGALSREPSLAEGLAEVARLILVLAEAEKAAIFQRPGTPDFHLAQAAGLRPSGWQALSALALEPEDLGIEEEGTSTAAMQPRLPRALGRIFEEANCLAWPLRARGNLLGMLLVEQGPGERGNHKQLLSGIANELTVAMENARQGQEIAAQQRLERELEVARDIQASFLPSQPPDVPGWEVSAFWRAARQVGGDFYDFIPLRPGEHGERWGLVIADVSDKGVPAALYMALSRTLLRTMAIGLVTPAATLSRVNRLVQSDSSSEFFVTAFYGVWEPAIGRLRYAVGGHPGPIWLDAQGQPRQAPGRGPLIGVYERVSYEEQEIYIGPGEVLLLYTDGLPDAINLEETPFGTERIVEALQECRACGAREIQQMLVEAVEAHASGAEAVDDITLVVVKREAA